MRHELRLRRRAIIGWTIGLAFFGVLYMAFYPALPDEMLELDFESIEVYKSMGFRTMATFDGYMLSSVFNFLPLLAGVFGVVLGVGALAGEEDSGTLELLASLPVSRLRLYSAKAAALIVAALVVTLAVTLIVTGVFLLLQSEIDTSVTAADMFWVLMGHWLIIFAFLGLGMFLGAFMPSRGSALAAASAVIVITFFGNNLAGMVTGLERVQPLFPFWHFTSVAEMLTGDVPWDSILVLLAMGVVPLGLGALAFQRRDLTVGSWLWQRPRPGDAADGEAVEGAAGGAMGRRPVVVALAIIALLACCCVSSGAIAVVASDDLRTDLRDSLGIDDVVKETVDLEAGRVPAVATASGRVETVVVSEGDVVQAGDVLLILGDVTEVVAGAEADEVLEGAWTLLDELSTGTSTETVEDLAAAVATASSAAEDADRAWLDGPAAGESPRAIAELQVHAELTLAALGIAEARLALAEDGPSAADVGALEDALRVAQPGSEDGSLEVGQRAVRAPVSGTVAEILAQEGDSVEIGQTVVLIAPDEPGDTLELVVRVSEEDAEKIDVGQSVEVDVDDFDDPFDGTVVDVYAVSDRTGDDDADDGDADGEDANDEEDADDAVDADNDADDADDADNDADDADDADDDADDADDADDDADDGDDADDDDDSDDDDLPFVVRIAIADAKGQLEPGLSAEVRIELE